MQDTDLAKNPPSTVKELGIHLIYISKELDGLRNDMKNLPNGFASVKDIADLRTSTNDRLTALEKSKARGWVFNTLSAVAGAILLFLVQYTLTH